MNRELRARALIEEGIDRLALDRDIRLSSREMDRLVSRVMESVRVYESDDADDLDDDDENEIFEDVAQDVVFYVAADCSIGGKAVREGDFIEITAVDMDGGTATFDVFDDEGEVREEDISATIEEIEKLEDEGSLEEVEEENESGEICEAKVIRGGKKVTISSKMQALKKKLAAKKTGDGVNKFTIKDGKIVKKSSKQIKADKKKSKTFAKRMKKFARKRAKSLKKSRAMNEGVEIREMLVSEGFDVKSGDMIVALQESDSVFLSDGTMKVVREGTTIVDGVAVDEAFENECVSESLFIIVENGDPEYDDEDLEDEEIAEGKDKDCEDDPKEEEVTEGRKTKKGKTNETRDPSADPEDEHKPSKETVEDTDPTEDPEDEFANESLTYAAGKGYVLVTESGERALGNRVRARAVLMNEGKTITADILDRASRGEKVRL